jgi:hypothetical protein
MKFFAGVIVLISCSLLIIQCAEIIDCGESLVKISQRAIKQKFSHCAGSELGENVKVTVSDCDTKQPRCLLKRGTNATITIDFKLSE